MKSRHDRRAITLVPVGWRSISWPLILLLLTCGVALGQSGRRAGQKPDAAVSQPSAGQNEEQAAQPASALLSLIVMDQFSSEDIPPSSAREIVQSFVTRLRERSSAIAVTLERDFSRKEAVQRAQKVQRAYVVWLQVQPDRPGGEEARPDIGDTGEFITLVLHYVVFAPGNAEIRTEGRIYYQHLDEKALAAAARSSNRNRKPRKIILRQPSEETFEGVGRAAADRVVASFKDILPLT
jgi:hypothetical protein